MRGRPLAGVKLISGSAILPKDETKRSYVKYFDLASMPYYKECAPIAERFGCTLLSIKAAGSKVSVVIAPRAGSVLGVNECALVHKALLPKMEALLKDDNIAFELSSPGVERKISNAAEFEVFAGYAVRLFVRRGEESGKWIEGKIARAEKDAVVVLTKENEAAGNIKEEKRVEMEVKYSDIVKATLWCVEDRKDV